MPLIIDILDVILITKYPLVILYIVIEDHIQLAALRMTNKIDYDLPKNITGICPWCYEQAAVVEDYLDPQYKIYTCNTHPRVFYDTLSGYLRYL
jgi:hypothetical protein